jgi:hypothetical protein
MRQTILAAAVAFVVGGITTGAALSQAQPAPPAPPPGSPPGPSTTMPSDMMPMQGPGPHGMMGHRMMGRHGPFNPRDFALLYRHPDLQLSPADVQKIAEAFLLWHGNHSWKITDVAATPEGPIGFSVTTAEGSLVAKFTMDPHTGRINRVG